jgi:hypothetical protein
MPTTRIQVPDTERHPGSALQRLPHELLNNVFQRVSTKDLSALRCTCTNLASVGLDHFGTEVALISHRDKSRALTEIATHPVLSKRMTSLFYMCDRLFDWTHAGVRQTIDLARAAANAGLELDSLTLVEISHRLWDPCSDEVMSNMKALFRPLRRLRLSTLALSVALTDHESIDLVSTTIANHAVKNF